MKFTDITNSISLPPAMETVKKWYDTWDVEILAEDIDFEVIPNYPAGGAYKGRDSVINDYLPALMSSFDDWQLFPQQLLDAGEAAIGLGYYEGKTKGVDNTFQVPFCHIWWVREEQIYKARGFCDTHHLQKQLPEYFVQTDEKTNHVSILKKWYEAALNGDTEAISPMFSDDIMFQMADGFGAGGQYRGKTAVLQKMFPAFFSQFEELRAYPYQFIPAGDWVTVTGEYHGKTKATRLEFRAQFTHIITLTEGKISQILQFTDSAAYAGALGAAAISEMEKATQPYLSPIK